MNAVVRKISQVNNRDKTSDSFMSRCRSSATEVALKVSCDVTIIQLLTPTGTLLTVNKTPKKTGEKQNNSQIEPIIRIDKSTVIESIINLDGTMLSLPIFRSIGNQTAKLDPIITNMLSSGVQSLGVIPIIKKDRLVGSIECHYKSKDVSWNKEIFLPIYEIADQLLAAFPDDFFNQTHEIIKDSENDAKKISALGDLLFMKISPSILLEDIIGDTVELIGKETGELLHKEGLFLSLIEKKQAKNLTRRLKESRMTTSSFEEEIDIVHSKSNIQKTFLVRVVPCKEDESFSGWQAVAIDITDKKRIERELLLQKKRLEALFEISYFLHKHNNPERIIFSSLQILMKITTSKVGYTALINNSNTAEIIAAQGISADLLESVEKSILSHPAIAEVIRTQDGLLCQNIHRSDDFIGDSLRIKDHRGCIIVPLISKKRVFGIITLYSSWNVRYHEEDISIVEAGAQQLCLVVETAQTHLYEKNYSDALTLLYDLYHKVSKGRSLSEVAEIMFDVVKTEIKYKRIWFGTVNEQGTHVIIHSTRGVDLDSSRKKMQIAFANQNSIFDQALESLQPIFTTVESSLLSNSGFDLFLKELKIEEILIVPLVALGKLAGVLIVEPEDYHDENTNKKLDLLMSMGREVATVILARSLEQKITETEKMKAANLLASGMSHVFNNILQTILGQASLIELKTKENQEIVNFAKIIKESANRGATIIQRLSTFSAISTRSEQFDKIELNSFLLQSKSYLISSFPAKIKVEMRIPSTPFFINGDYSLIQQAIVNILLNARDALMNEESGLVVISVESKRVNIGDIHPDLLPGLYTLLTVTDDGVGMNEEELRRCFEPFYTTKDIDALSGVGYRGTGLGLSSAYSIVKLHHGVITAESIKGKGATIRVYLPQLEEKDDIKLKEAADIDSVPDAMMICADIDTQKIVNYEFESVGLRVINSGRWNSALEFIQLGNEIPKILILDVDTVKFGLVNFLNTLLDDSGNLKILVITTEPKKIDKLVSKISNVEVYGKPLQREAVQNILRKLFLQRNSYQMMYDIGLEK